MINLEFSQKQILKNVNLMTRFSSLTGPQEVLIAIFVRGFAQAFHFEPINSSILSEFKGATLAQVSGLLNLFRQIGGSMGMAFVATMIIKNNAQNLLDLSSHVSLLNQNTQQVFSPLKQSMEHKIFHLIGMDNPDNAALKIFRYKMEDQLFIMSVKQLFYYLNWC